MTTIWAIGASVRALAQSLLAKGHEVLAADLFNDFDLQQIARKTQRIIDYPHDLLKLVDDVKADAFVYTGGLESYPDLIDTLAGKLQLWGNPGEVLRRVRDIQTLREALERGGFQMPPLGRSVPVGMEQRWLRKSQHSSGGLRIAWAESNHAPLVEGEYFQQFIDGPVYGAAFVAAAGGIEMLGIARQLTDCSWSHAPAFHYAGSMGPIRLPADMHCEVERLGRLVAHEFQLQGWFGIDLIVDSQQQLWVLEVNPRYTASMELLEAGRFASPVSGKAILYAQRPMAVASDLAQRLIDRGDVADIPGAGSEIAAGSPMLTLFAQGQTEAGVLADLKAKSQDLQTELSLASAAAHPGR